jgi:hypothetical protein
VLPGAVPERLLAVQDVPRQRQDGLEVVPLAQQAEELLELGPGGGLVAVGQRELTVDPGQVDRAGGGKTWLDYDHHTGAVTFGTGGYRHDGHVFFVRGNSSVEDDVRMLVLESDRPEDIANPYGLAARFLWEKWGRAGHERAPPPPFDAYVAHVLRWAFSEEGWAESVWQEVSSVAAAPVFIVDVGRHPSVPKEKRTWREPRSIWNQTWFSTQRCANGLYRLGEKDRARKMTEIALSAPLHDGLFPSVLLADENEDDNETRWRWTHSDRRPPEVNEDACHLVDAAFTCRMLLDWHALTGEPRALERVQAFAARAVREQHPGGYFPGYIRPNGHRPAQLNASPESAVTASLLFELGETDAALRTMGFLETSARNGEWTDFETYWSCSRWGSPNRRVERNGVLKQNTLSIFWCAEAFLHAWRATKKPSHLALARRCLDELSLYQAVWDPPFLPAPAHGGFGVMNADAEWNDSRQSLFAPLYFEMYRETNEREYLERGLSALRASFSMMYCPENAGLAKAYEERFPFFGPESYGFMMENQGHDPETPIGTFTIYTWGPGSAIATLALVRERFADLLP